MRTDSPPAAAGRMNEQPAPTLFQPQPLPPMKPPKSSPAREGSAQPDLFGDLPPGAVAPGPTLVAIPTPAASQSKAQRAFNRLIGQIEQQRELLLEWQRYEQRHHQRLTTELEPLRRKLLEGQRVLLGVLDDLLTDRQANPRLTKPQRRKLRAWIPHLAGTLLDDGPDAEVEAIFDRHCDFSYAEQQQAELAEAEAMFSVLGQDLIKGHQAQSVDELMQHAARNMAAQQRAAQAAAAEEPAHAQDNTPRGRRAEAARQAKAAAAEQASQSVREVFRKLASALHPDRETDAAERERKTALMQQANQAYQHNDLLTLLMLQLQTEQIDAEHLAGLSDARLLHYNQVLREQLQTLQQEVQACAQAYQGPMGPMGPTGRLPTPAAVDTALTLDIEQLRRSLVVMADDLSQLRDPARRRAFIDELELPDEGDEEPDAFEMMLMMDALAAAAPAPRRRRKRR